VEQIQQQRRQKSRPQAPSQPPSPKKPRSLLTIVGSVNLTEEQHTHLKKGLKDILDDIREQRPESQQHMTVSSSATPDSPSLLDTLNLTDQEYDIVKDRMRTIMKAFQTERQDTQKTPSQPKESRPKSQPKKEEPPPEKELTFEEICKKVGDGEPLDLFYKATLSDREKQMLKAFSGHMVQFKALKRQQTFDLQHLTGRSIRDLEEIFKLYQPQGYMRAELNNVYNRLLNLRSRFSILTH
jgi:hypothetical protein